MNIQRPSQIAPRHLGGARLRLTVRGTVLTLGALAFAWAVPLQGTPQAGEAKALPAGKTADAAIYQLNPSPDDPAGVTEALAVVDREITGLQSRMEAIRAAGARESAKQRNDEIKRLRSELGKEFTKARWDSLVGAIFSATETARLTAMKLDDATLWNLSKNTAFVESGRAIVAFNCVPCHLASLRGKGERPDAFGPDLTDRYWLHGGRPIDIYDFVTHGAFDKGMPPWGSLVGPKKVTEVVAYVLSLHQEGEPVYEFGSVPPAIRE